MFNEYSFVFDIDGTLCPIKKKEERYEDLIPYAKMVEKLRYYKLNGAKVILFTSRNMNSYDGNIGLINKNTAKVLMTWLDKWKIPYDEILYGKPWPGHKGFYVDDRTVRPDEFLKYSIEELDELCSPSKYMTVIITMAGVGSRFKKAGYKKPKYMIEAKGKSLFEWSMDSLIGYSKGVSKYVFVVRKEDNATGFIKKKCKNYNIGETEIIEIDDMTDGQATSGMLAIPYCKMEDAVMIYNIDTYVEPYEMKWENLSGDGHIPCFHGEGDHWSFAKTNKDGAVIEVCEKVRISNNCTLGAYYFSSARLYKELYEEYYADDSRIEKNEKYIAPLYNYMIKKGMPVTMSVVDSDKVHVLGTPEELDTFLKEDSMICPFTTQ